jgi:hypothetical protein
MAPRVGYVGSAPTPCSKHDAGTCHPQPWRAVSDRIRKYHASQVESAPAFFQRTGRNTMSNIVKLKLKNGRGTRRAQTKATDARLIEACITYAQCMAAHQATFRAAPDDAYSDKFTGAAFKRATTALRAAKSKATTAGGLQAKARIVPIVADDAEGSFEEEQVDFLLSFALDVKVFLDPSVEEEWRARIDGVPA